MATSGLTSPATFLKSAFLREFLKEKNVESLGDLRITFTKKDRIGAMLSMARLTLFPEGRHFADVQFEYNRQLLQPAKV